jgi:SAM-dependent methyltransferase
MWPIRSSKRRVWPRSTTRWTPDRSDLDAYVAMVDEFGARSVLDIGCGTGTLACLLARRGLSVTAVDPAGASLAVAGTKPGADRVRWVHGDATDLAPLQVDLVTMTANVFESDGAVLTSDSTLRFRHRDEVAASLAAAGLVLDEVREAPDRPGREMVFIARRAG